jgi:hypothetical protein
MIVDREKLAMKVNYITQRREEAEIAENLCASYILCVSA